MIARLYTQVPPLRRASRTVVRMLGVLQASAPKASITYAQGHALIELEIHGILTVSELARILGLNKSSTCRTLKQLSAHGWINACRTKSQREKPFALSPRGKVRLETLHRKVNARVQKALSFLNDQERTTVLQGMELYASALERSEALPPRWRLSAK